MKSDFRFSNLCGTVYRQGNVVFTPDGNCVLSPVGNRVTCFDLVNNKSFTFPFENRKNIARIALSPNGALLLSIDEDGHALLVNVPRRIIIARTSFNHPILAVQFSPDGRYFAVSHGKHVQVWRTPGFHRDFAPFVLLRTYTGHYDDVVGINWRADSQFFLTCSEDMSVRVYSLHPVQGYEVGVLAAHRDAVVNAWFSKDGQSIYSVSRDNMLFAWQVAESEQQDGLSVPKRFILATKHRFEHRMSKVVCATFHPASGLLVVGFGAGLFSIWELPEFSNVHSLSISQSAVDAVEINASGEWLAFGCAKLGQLLVWEWASESYVLKQQGHYYDMSCVAYSPDGANLATGGDDGKIKVWSAHSGYSFVTFNEHTAGVQALEFAKSGQVLLSASLDGTVRAFDLVRYRNFRTFTSPTPVQFNCMAVDPSGVVVCAGSLDSFDVYVWSVQTGKLLDILSGHEGPVTALAFSPTEDLLVSGSWDKTVRTWDVFGRDVNTESFQLQSDVLAIAFRPDGREVGVSTLDGTISFWRMSDAKQVHQIEGRRDIVGGRKVDDFTTAENSGQGKSFNSLCYTADGQYVLAGGNSKYVCIYNVETSMLIKRFQISHNVSLDGIMEQLNSKRMTEAGSLDVLEQETRELSEDEARDQAAQLPGVAKGDLSVRRLRPEIRTRCVRFSPTGRSWAAAATEGLLIYSLDDTLLFDPLDLDMDITPDTILATLQDGDYGTALLMALRLNEQPLIQQTYEAVPPPQVDMLARDVPLKYLQPLLAYIAKHLEDHPHVEFDLLWSTSLLKWHGRWLRTQAGDMASVLRQLKKAISRLLDDLSQMCDENSYSMKLVLQMRHDDEDDQESLMDVDGEKQT
ncbi:U3 snoRNP protein [Sorochytrium milnesiophthora]